MKGKLIALALFVASAFTAKAQDMSATTTDGGTYKPTAGNITTEVLFNDFAKVGLNDGLIRGRYFLSEASAIRLSAGLNYDFDKINDDAHSSITTITLAPGIEKHFAGTSRLSPYIGAELPLSFRGARYEDDDVTVKGSTGTTAGERGYMSIGINAVAGVDYYFARNFYVGLEIGTGLSYFKNADVDVDNDNGPDFETEGFHEIRFNQFANGGLRIGFVF